MDLFGAMEIVASGLTAQRVRLNVTASNLANAQTTRTEEGGHYKRRDPVFHATIMLSDPRGADGFESELASAMRGVEVTEIQRDPDPPRKVYDPTHPDATETGYVEMPNVNLVEEMVNMIEASRQYEAGITAMQNLTDMANRALQVGQ